MKKIIAAIAAVVLLIAIIALNPMAVVQAGDRGVVLTWGAYSGQSLEPGLHWRTPIAQHIVRVNVQKQKVEAEADAASKDLNNVKAKVALNFHIDPAHAGDLYRDIGTEVADRVIAPAIQEAVKATTAKYTAEELVTKREIVKQETLALLTTRLAKSYVVVDDLAFTNFEFSGSFNAAIEAKVTAEQEALAAKNKLEQVKYEAQQQIETAKAQAESIRIQAQALAQNQELVKLKATEKWDGKLPLYMIPGAVLPFIGDSIK